MKKREKNVEFKETEIFELFPKFSYTPEQRKRVILFHGYAKSYRKMINYAANFDEPNKICLVYLVGTIKDGAVETALRSSGCSDRVCVLTAEFPDEAMEVWVAYDDLREKTLAFGGWDKEQDRPTTSYLEKRKKIRDYYAGQMGDEISGQYGLTGFSEDYDVCRRMVDKYDSMMLTIKQYDKLKSKCGKNYFHNFRLHRSGRLEKPYTHEKLNELIKKIFPLGAESMGVDKYGFLSPASVELGIEFGKSGVQTGKLKLTDEMIAPAAKAIQGLITKRIAEQGYCTLHEVQEIAFLPPFGLAHDGFSAACLSRALHHFDNRTLLLYDGCGTFEVKGLEGGIYSMAFGPAMKARFRRFDKCCIYMESQPHKKVKQFMSRLWGIKIRMPGTLMGLYLWRDLCGTHNVPLKYVDERLLHLTLWDVDFWDRSQVERLADEIEAHGEEILAKYERYKEINSNIPQSAKSLMNADYSWCWEGEEYSDILWQTEKYGPWPWDNETHNKVRSETEMRRKSV